MLCGALTLPRGVGSCQMHGTVRALTCSIVQKRLDLEIFTKAHHSWDKHTYNSLESALLNNKITNFIQSALELLHEK